MTGALTAPISLMKPTVSARTMNSAAVMENALRLGSGVTAQPTAETTRTKLAVLVRTTSFAAEMEAASMSAGSAMELQTAATTLMKGTACARPTSSGVVMGPALTSLGSAIAHLTAGITQTNTTARYPRLAELTSSSADLASASGYLRNVTDAVTVPMEVMKRAAVLLMNSTARTGSAFH